MSSSQLYSLCVFFYRLNPDLSREEVAPPPILSDGHLLSSPLPFLEETGTDQTGSENGHEGASMNKKLVTKT